MIVVETKFVTDVSPSSQSSDPESQTLTDGTELHKFSVKERVSSVTDVTLYSNSDNSTMVRQWQ